MAVDRFARFRVGPGLQMDLGSRLAYLPQARIQTSETVRRSKRLSASSYQMY